MNWRVQVLGRLALSRGEQVVTRFESRKVAALLAYLALFPRNPHSREELIEMLWAEADPDVGLPRFRQALYALRRQMEPPGTPPGSVLLADRYTVQLNPAAFTCDALDFERLVRQKRIADARALYTGELLPGFYEDWILRERDRLALLAENLPSLTDSPAADRKPEPETEPLAPRENVTLPCYLTEFFGRAEEKQALRTRLLAHRLLTLTGTGGLGKTRLTVETARTVTDAYDLVVFVPLAECFAPEQIADYIRASLLLPAAGTAAFEQILQRLADRKTLLILDNFEQLVDSGGAVVLETLLTHLPLLTCLVTSRRLLGIDGEQEFPLAPLPAPPEDASLRDTAENPGVALFLRRAQGARPGFQMTENNRADLTAVCRALEGIPLALELAASRVRVLSPAEMRRQIQNRFEWLVRSGPAASKEPRQRSLAAALDWSWRLLPTAQQRFLAALSVFRGGWTAERAAEVCAVSDARQRLESLVMDSLVHSEEMPDGTTRFRTLEMVRDFARERVTAESLAALRRRHQSAFLAFARENAQNGAALLTEAENLRAALETAVEQEEMETAFALCRVIEDRWLALAGAETTLALLQRTLKLPGGDSRARAEVLYLAAQIALFVEDAAHAATFVEEAVHRAGTRPAERALALIGRARIALACKDLTEDIGDWLEEALVLAQESGDQRLRGIALRLWGSLANYRGDFAEAEQILREAYPLLEEAGDWQNLLFVQDSLANTAVQRGDLERALELYSANRQRARALGNFVYETKVTQNLATVYARQARWEESLVAGQECIRENRALGNNYIVAFALWNIIEPFAHSGQTEVAAQLMGFILRYWVEQYGPLDEADDVYCEEIRTLVTAELGTEQITALYRAGERLTLAQAVALALEK